MLVFKVSSGLVLSLATLVGSVYLYRRFSVKTIEEWLDWHGHQVAKRDASFKAIYLEKKDDLRELYGKDEEVASDIEKGFKKIKDWCNQHLPNSWKNKSDEDWNKIFKFCVVRPTTARAALVDGRSASFVNDLTEEEGKVLFSVLKGKGTFPKEVIEKKDISSGAAALRELCKRELDKKISDLDYPPIVLPIFCKAPGYTTIGQKIEKEGREKITDESTFKNLFSANKSNQDFMSLINAQENSSIDSDDQKGVAKLKSLCDTEWNKKIYDMNDFGKEYVRILGLCSKEKTVKPY